MEMFDLINNADNLHLMETEYDCHGLIKKEKKRLPNTLEAIASDGNNVSKIHSPSN